MKGNERETETETHRGTETKRAREGGKRDKPRIPGMLKLAMKRSALDYLPNSVSFSRHFQSALHTRWRHCGTQGCRHNPDTNALVIKQSYIKVICTVGYTQKSKYIQEEGYGLLILLSQ